MKIIIIGILSIVLSNGNVIANDDSEQKINEPNLVLECEALSFNGEENDISKDTCESYDTVNDLLDWASYKYPHLFESDIKTKIIAGYLYRHYPKDNIYLGSKDRELYGLGHIFGDDIIHLGKLDSITPSMCREELEPGTWIQYKAYQPLISPGEEFCFRLPDANTLTQLIFDYTDIKYRDMAIGFKISKDNQSTVVFSQDPKVHRSGTVVLRLSNEVLEINNNYIIEIWFINDNGDRHNVEMYLKV